MPILTLDTTSPRVTIAVGEPHRLVTRHLEQQQSSRELLRSIDEALSEAGLTLTALDGFCALRGPGSFTGTRIGLATILAFHQALGAQATALSTLDVLAAAAHAPEPVRIVAAVDALRGDWQIALYDGSTWPPPQIEPPRLVAAKALSRLAPCCLVGYGIDEPLHRSEVSAAGLAVQQPTCLAATAVRLAALETFEWSSKRLLEPLYHRPPAVSRGSRG